MSYILRKYARRQPPEWAVTGDHPLTAGLISVTPPLDKRLTYYNRAARYSGAFVNANTDTSLNDYERVSTQWGDLIGSLSTSVSSTDSRIQLPATEINAALGISLQASAIVIARTFAQDAGGDSGPFVTHGGGTLEHYPYLDNNIYLSTFSSSRWVNGVPAPSFINSPHMMAFSVQNGAQEFWINGVSMATGTSAVTPAVVNGGMGGIRAYTYFAAIWNRLLLRAEVEALYENPWQIYSPRQRRVYSLPAAGGTQSFSYTASGGITFAGAAAQLRAAVRAAAGGIVFAGTSAMARVAARLAAGGIVFGGAATVAFHSAVRTVQAAGGIVFGGNSVISYVGQVASEWILRVRRRGRR